MDIFLLGGHLKTSLAPAPGIQDTLHTTGPYASFLELQPCNLTL